MQNQHRVSLNAVRVFAVVVRTGSLTAAGAELGVTSGAVSHQIRNLEDELGVRFFRRGNNTISLTEAGERFFEEIAPAVGLIERAANALYRDETEVSVRASMSLAVRWLIPSLDRFRAAFPEILVRVETGFAPGRLDADVDIRYFRAGDAIQGWQLLARDLSRPVVSPNLPAATARSRPLTLSGIPALQRTAGNWDWQLWCETFGIPLADLSFTHIFDTDDAALHACVAGLGMVLAPPILTRREIHSGALVELPGCATVEIGAYRYRRHSPSRAARQFCDWLDAEVRNPE